MPALCKPLSSKVRQRQPISALDSPVGTVLPPGLGFTVLTLPGFSFKYTSLICNLQK